MKYDYKFVPISQWLVKKRGEDTMGQALARYIREIVENSSGDDWEYYRTDTYMIYEEPGCFASFFGAQARLANYNLLVFRREVKEEQ